MHINASILFFVFHRFKKNAEREQIQEIMLRVALVLTGQRCDYLHGKRIEKTDYNVLRINENSISLREGNNVDELIC